VLLLVSRVLQLATVILLVRSDLPVLSPGAPGLRPDLDHGDCRSRAEWVWARSPGARWRARGTG